MIFTKTKMATAMAAIGYCIASATPAYAGLVEVNVSATTGVPTFSTDISGVGSAAQPFFAPDVRWSPGIDIGTNSSVRFNLGGVSGNPAQFVTNPITVDNFYLTTVGASTVAFSAVVKAVPTTYATGLTGGAMETTNVGANATLFSVADKAAVAAAADASVVATNTNVPTVAAITAAIKATTAYASDLVDATAINAAAVTTLNANVATDAAAYIAGYAAAAAGGAGAVIAGITPVVAGRYTNGDSATWFAAGGAAFGRIFNTTTAGGLNSFDVTVVVNVALKGDATLSQGGDKITLSLNTGKYVTGAGVAVPFATGTLLGTRVDISNLKAQGFDGLPLPVVNPDGNGSLRMFVSVQQGGLTRDATNVQASPFKNAALYASSANPFRTTTFIGSQGLATTLSLPSTINTATAESKFSIPGGAAATWFNGALDAGATFNHLGSFNYNVASLATAVAYNPFGAAALPALQGKQVSDPNGAPYALTAGDVLAVTITGSSPTSFNPFAVAGAAMYLRAGVCTGVAAAGDIALVPAAGVGLANATATQANASLVAGTTYDLCAFVPAANTSVIEAQTATLAVSLNNIEPTYQDPVLPGGPLGTWARNGCSVTFFNVPANIPGTAGVDVPFLRFTNTTASATAGTVRISVWDQTGARIGAAGSLLTNALAPNGIVGHHTGVYNVTDLATSLGLAAPVAPAKYWNGRARVVMSGGFATCEGQNLVRSSTGALTNLTATTNANQNTANIPTVTTGFLGNNGN